MTTRTRQVAGPAVAAPRPELDRFAEILRAGEMGPRLADALGGRARTCHVLDAKYEPGVRATVLYEYAGVCVRGDLVPDGELPVGPAHRPGGPARVPVVAPGLRISVFPEDPDLPSLPRVMDPAYLGPVLAEALRDTARPETPAPRTRCRTTLIRYRPGRRVTLRVAFVGRAGGYVAKVYHDPRKAAAVAEEAPALAQHAGGCVTLRIPSTAAHLPADGMVVQEAVSGLPLEALLLGRSLATSGGAVAATEAMMRAARALAELHRMPPATGRRRSVAAELERFAHRAAGIAAVEPRTGEALIRLAERLRTTQPDQPAVTGTVHGDCKPSQMLLDHQQVLLMDLDHGAVSDQAMDVGTFLASLRQLPLRRSGTGPSRPGQALAALRSTFLASYLEARGDSTLLARIAWQEAVALERKALRAWARAPGAPVARALAREAEACLDSLTATR